MKTKISNDKILVLIKKRLQTNKINRRKETISREAFSVTKNQITEDLLEIIEEWNS